MLKLLKYGKYKVNMENDVWNIKKIQWSGGKVGKWIKQMSRAEKYD